MINEFLLAEEAETAKVLEKRKDEFVQELQRRVEDLEINSPTLDEPITKLTNSDDLEAVKMTVNHIIDILSGN
jgi:hypothetical protein